MNQNNQLKLIRAIQNKEIDLLQSKGNDYANDEDVLKNFKEVTEICRILNIDTRTGYGTYLFYMILKLQRICNLLQEGKEAQNESILDTCIDFRNYIGLLMMGYEDGKVKPTEGTPLL